MIIKSMPRKDASFGQLITYITDEGKAEKKYYYGHNTFSNVPEEALRTMLNNAKHIKARKNGNYMYHEVVSITREPGVSTRLQKESLRDIIIEYLEKRAPNNMAFCALHDDHEGHLHYHLIISANSVGEGKKTRLSKKQFSDIKVNLENYVLEHHSALKQQVIIGRKSGQRALHKNEKETRITKRGKTSRVEHLSEVVGFMLDQAKTEKDFEAALKKVGLEYYVRGKTPGIIDTGDGKKYRLKRLGLTEAFGKMVSRQAEPASSKSPDGQPASGDAINEWVFGDFEKRDQKSKADAFKQRKAKDKLSTGDKVREWTHGDFSARDELAAQKAFEKTNKIISEEDEDLSNEDKRKEWLQGDFSAREERIKAKRIKDWIDEKERSNKKTISEQRESEIKKKRQSDKDNNDSQNSNRRK